MADSPMNPQADRQADFRQLGRLARARLTAKDYDLVAGDGLANLVDALADRQVRWKGDFPREFAALADDEERFADRLFEFCETDIQGLVLFDATLETREAFPESMSVGEQAIVDQGRVGKSGFVMHGARNCNHFPTDFG